MSNDPTTNKIGLTPTSSEASEKNRFLGEMALFFLTRFRDLIKNYSAD
jgi:hypothetical protein